MGFELYPILHSYLFWVFLNCCYLYRSRFCDISLLFTLKQDCGCGRFDSVVLFSRLLSLLLWFHSLEISFGCAFVGHGVNKNLVFIH